MEHAIQFGAFEHLSGIFNDGDTEGADHPNGAHDTAVIMVTPGMLSHAGPFRLHVEMAKSLAEAKIPSFRFDLSGIGESFGIGHGGVSLDRAVNEIQTAVDWLGDHHSIQRVILFGLCSGADDGLAAAAVDPRIVGLVAMDGCGYRTPGYHWHRLIGHYLPRVLRVSNWRDIASRKWQKWFGGPSSTGDSPSSLQPGDDIREFPNRDIAAVQIAHLAEQGTEFHFLYTGGVADYYNHAGQFRAMFPELAHSKRVSSEYWPSIDHVAFLCEDRRALVEHVTEQIRRITQRDPARTLSDAAHPC